MLSLYMLFYDNPLPLSLPHPFSLSSSFCSLSLTFSFFFSLPNLFISLPRCFFLTLSTSLSFFISSLTLSHLAFLSAFICLPLFFCLSPSSTLSLCLPLSLQVYIFENNIYYQQSQTSVAQRLTSSGTEGVVYNGIADWLYEEEVLGTSAAHWCSPDGAWLTFAQINDTLVPKMEIPRYLGQLYPRAKIYPYPKMRQPLPSVSLFLVKLYGSAHTLQILPPESLRFSQYYVTMVSWVSNTSLAVRWLNRAQNVSLLTRCEVTTGACVEKHKISSDGWLSKQGEQLLFSPDGSTFFLTVPTQQGAGGRFWHLARFTARAQHTGEESHFITSGSFDVTSLFAYDERSQRIYFESSEEAPTTRHLYSASLSGSLHRQCLTCGLLPDCTWPRVQLSPGLSHFLLSCYGSGVPTHSVHRVADPRDFFLLTDNQDLREAVKNRQMPLTKLHTLAGGTRIRADSVSRSGSSWTGGLS
ncbi:inactive dipeptidyl peptidase 10-like isoform X6 [Hypanus sabinus]|uniref:inactive dipeptidyl peptidase 10-like isoform X6 n=1 Tax=Hypanus sabinus TaxID=79690 RepID=UPI0028C3C5A3|nr:inactive dipeptidyl peptidase 10-like isoform X6 [Hypanus sabinus]